LYCLLLLIPNAQIASYINGPYKISDDGEQFVEDLSMVNCHYAEYDCLEDPYELNAPGTRQISRMVIVETTRVVEAGEELFVRYGKTFQDKYITFKGASKKADRARSMGGALEGLDVRSARSAAVLSAAAAASAASAAASAAAAAAFRVVMQGGPLAPSLTSSRPQKRQRR
jgi:hypothetical protein